MTPTTVAVSIKGQTRDAPAFLIQDRAVLTSGRLIRTATLHDEEWLEGPALHNPAEFVSELRSIRPKVDLFSFIDSQPDYAERRPYRFEWDNVAVIRAASYDAWWKALSQDARRNVRLAEKRGAKIMEVPFDDQLVAGIKGIYDETPIRQGRQFWHYGKDLAAVRNDNATYAGRSRFIGAFVGEELIGFIKMVLVGNTARIMQILSKNAQFEKKPANAMIAKAVEIANREGKTFLAYCRYTYGNKKSSSITEFKRRNGFEELRFPRYYVPLTPKGHLLVRSRLHRGVKNLLPEPVTNFLLNARARFYDWRAKRASPQTANPPADGLSEGT
jgi:hypothetical protein